MTFLIIWHIYNKKMQMPYLPAFYRVKAQQLQFTVCHKRATKLPQLSIHSPHNCTFNSVKKIRHWFYSGLQVLYTTNSLKHFITLMSFNLCPYRWFWAICNGVVTPADPFTLFPSANRIITSWPGAVGSPATCRSHKDLKSRNRSARLADGCSWNTQKMHVRLQTRDYPSITVEL